MTEDEFTASFNLDRSAGEVPTVILRDGTTTTVRGIDSANKVVLCDRGRTIALADLERTGSTYFERTLRGTPISRFKGDRP